MVSDHKKQQDELQTSKFANNQLQMLLYVHQIMFWKPMKRALGALFHEKAQFWANYYKHNLIPTSVQNAQGYNCIQQPLIRFQAI